MEPSTTVVIVGFNSAQVIASCLHSLPPDVRVILVDNASRDDTIAAARAARPGIEILAQPRNLGYGAAANAGLERASTPFGLLLNPDVRFSPDLIARLAAAAERHPDAGMLAPSVGSGEGPGRRIFWDPPAPLRVERAGADRILAYVGGPAMFFRMAAFRAVGGFDARLFLFYEDDDICIRMRLAGYDLVQVLGASIAHGGGKSTSGVADLEYWKQWHMGWSRLYVERKYRGRVGMLRRWLRDGTENALKRAFRPRDPRQPRYRGRLDGMAAYLRGIEARAVAIGGAGP